MKNEEPLDIYMAAGEKDLRLLRHFLMSYELFFNSKGKIYLWIWQKHEYLLRSMKLPKNSRKLVTVLSHQHGFHYRTKNSTSKSPPCASFTITGHMTTITMIRIPEDSSGVFSSSNAWKKRLHFSICKNCLYFQIFEKRWG